MHRRKLPEWFYHHIPELARVFEDHHLLHHHKYYRIFDYEPDLVGRYLNISLNPWLGVFYGSFVWIPLFFFSSPGSLIFVFTIIAHHLLWSALHQEMHVPSRSFLSHLSLYQYLARYHWMHHAYPGANYNIVFPLMDFFLKTHRCPSQDDKRAMRLVGL
ncbi:MAG: hypothetical protein HY268_05265 [Deltaproteobacteria bacterium]|nr:hypothetical protein [Deltaproteobacteria bacterium]